MLSRQALAGVIEPRVEEIFALVQQVIRDSGHEELLSSGVVLTGGSSVMPGMVELGGGHLPQAGAARRAAVFRTAGRHGRPARAATAMGLLEWRALDRLRGHKVAQKTGTVQDALGRIRGLVRRQFRPAGQAVIGF